MFCKTYSAGLIGIEGYVVEVETDLSRGIPHCSLVGLPDSAVKESKERVRSALLNSGFEFPLRRMTVNFAPAHLKKIGATYDLSVAVGILHASAQIDLPFLQDTLFLGELSLDGRIKPVHGLLPMALAAKKKGIQKIVVPLENTWEAVLSGMETYPLSDLRNLPNVFLKPTDVVLTPPVSCPSSLPPPVVGHAPAKRALQIAAAGFHNLYFIGPPGTGKTMLASTLPSILPPLSHTEWLEIISIQSAAGKHLSEKSLETFTRPFRTPHHSITQMGLIGGGNLLRPGEITLAHHGVLYLDEMSEFPRSLLELLRQPIEERKITLNRNRHHIVFPARFMLVASMNPCPCGYYGFAVTSHPCTCSSTMLEKFRRRISGPLLDRFDLQLEVPRIEGALLDLEPEKKDHHSVVLEQILQAVGIQQERFNRSDFKNADMGPADVTRYCSLNKAGKNFIRDSYKQFDMSHRTLHKVLKIARTIADLHGREQITEVELAESIYFRTIEKNFF